jgi:hypothetical protein
MISVRKLAAVKAHFIEFSSLMTEISGTGFGKKPLA